MSVAKVYGKALLTLASGGINFTADTIKCSLHTSVYTPDQDGHDYFNDVTSEVTGSGYTAGGVTVTGCTATYDSATNTLTLDCADPAWTAATITNIRYAVFRKDSGTAATSPLICYIDFETDQSVSGANLSIAIPVAGLVSLSAA